MLNKIEQKLNSLKGKRYYFEYEGRCTLLLGFNTRGESIEAIFQYGYGVNIERTTYSFKENELQNFINALRPPKEPHRYKYSKAMSDKTENNISGLRSYLFAAIQKLEGGTMKADEAKALAALAQTIINSAKLELDYKRMIEKQPNIKMLNS